MPMPEGPANPAPRYRWTFAASVVALAGALVLAGAGLCVGAALFDTIYAVLIGPPQWSPVFEWAWIPVGIIPLAIGFALIREGLGMRRTARNGGA